MSDLHTELMRVKEKRGALTPRILIDEAKPRNHPLHDQFTWNNAAAGDKWRLYEARQLLRVTFRHTFDDGRTADLRHFWPVRAPDEKAEDRHWESGEVIAQDPRLRTLKLQEMLREWKRMKMRYQNYSEFFEMVRNDPDFIDPDEQFGDDDNGTEG